MMTVKYKARGFDPWDARNGDGFIDTTWPELLHAAITVGRRGWHDVLKHGRYSLFEMLYRAAMLRANLRRSQGRIRKSDAYHGLDPSEKAAASYFIGLTLAGLMARRLFGVRWLMHLDVYHNTLQPHLSDSGRPDLVGSEDMRQWYVIEAKGRSYGLDRNVVAKAKAQTKKVRTVCGRAPRLRVASVAYFSRGSLSMHLEDPVGQDVDAIDWDFTENQFLRDYYDPFAALFDQNDRSDARDASVAPRSERVSGTDFWIEELPDLDLVVGLEQSVYDIHRSADDVRGGLREAITRALAGDSEGFIGVDVPATHEGSDSDFIGDDGILVRVGPSWLGSDE